jgi:hypothetical protein
MIISTSRLKASSGGRAIANHLARTDENEIVVEHCGDYALMHEWMADARDAGCKYGLRHWSINADPRYELTADQAHGIARAMIREFAGDPDDYVLIEHRKRRRGYDEAPSHFHVVAPEWQAARERVLESHNDYLRAEMIARKSEIVLRHDLTAGRHTKAVVQLLSEREQNDAAAEIHAAVGAQMPTASYSKTQAQRAKRLGYDIGEVRDQVAAAWRNSDSSDALSSALEEHGLHVQRGDKAGTWIVTTDAGDVLGALDRLAGKGVKKADVAARMTSTPATEEAHQHEREAERSADPREEAGSNRSAPAADRGEDRRNQRPAEPGPKRPGSTDSDGRRDVGRRPDRADHPAAAADHDRQQADPGRAGRDRQPSRQDRIKQLAAAFRRLTIRSRMRRRRLDNDHSHGPKGP